MTMLIGHENAGVDEKQMPKIKRQTRAKKRFK